MSVCFLSGIPKEDRGGTGNLMRNLEALSEARNLGWSFVYISAFHLEPANKSSTPAPSANFRLRVRRALRQPHLLPFKIIRKIKTLFLRRFQFIELSTETPSRALAQSESDSASGANKANADYLAAENLILLHPQSLGYGLTLDVLRAREQTYMYVLDNSFFCRASYNHLPGENKACLRCLGGSFEAAEQNGCHHFPHHQSNERQFERALMELAKQGKVHFLAQSRVQADLLRQHFGAQAEISNVGIFADYDQQWDGASVTGKLERPLVVFHANPLKAKGVDWAIELAGKLDEFDFVFPCLAEEIDYGSVPENITFKPMDWANGLKAYVQKANYVLCPSIWSAPVEGALVKSVLSGTPTIVVDETSAYQSELSDNIVVRVAADVVKAAEQIRADFEKRPATKTVLEPQIIGLDSHSFIKELIEMFEK